MLKLYSEKRARKVIEGLDAPIREAAEGYGVPMACIRSVLLLEITGMDILDGAADGAVYLHWLFYRLFGREPSGKGPLRKRDSSTGFAQVFAATAIRSIRFGAERGLTPPGFSADRLPGADNPKDLCRIWRMLRADRRFNVHAAALTLLCAAEEMTGTTDFSRLSPRELQLVFTRYNADTRQITPYGEAAYKQYLEYQKAG